MLIFPTCLWILEQRLIAMILKVAILHLKMISKIQLIGNKEVTLFVKLNR